MAPASVPRSVYGSPASRGADCCVFWRGGEKGVGVGEMKGGRLVGVLEGGEVAEEVRPDMCPFACALGGSDGRTLFVCVAPVYDAASRKAKSEAAILSVRVEVPAS